ncbi:MAG: alpha/beta fold hydrolase [Flavobacteriales bacterium]
MELFYRELGEGQPLVILHGLFGFSDNWQTQAKKFAEYYRVILVDLRNHGHSPWSEDFSYELMVSDLEELFQTLQLKNVILLGHSMGGKVAMHFAQKNESLLDKLIVVDMGVKSYPLHHQHILAAFNQIDLSKLSARSEAESILKQFIDSEGVRQFLLKNLYWKEKGKLSWRVNFPVLEAAMPEILSSLPMKEVFIPTLFIRGMLSNYILDEDISTLEEYFPDAQIISVEDAGHWVHAEAPEAFVDSVLGFCLR